jgi:hypothetical protein
LREPLPRNRTPSDVTQAQLAAPASDRCHATWHVTYNVQRDTRRAGLWVSRSMAQGMQRKKRRTGFGGVSRRGVCAFPFGVQIGRQQRWQRLAADLHV